MISRPSLTGILHGLVALTLLPFALAANASTPEVGNPLPAVVIEEKGEITLSEDELNYVAWSSSSNPGKAHVLQYFRVRRVLARFLSRLPTCYETTWK